MSISFDGQVVIVTGAGRAFVAGADIQEISGLAGAVGAGFSRRGQAVFTRIERYRAHFEQVGLGADHVRQFMR